jgi:hypothetical protein
MSTYPQSTHQPMRIQVLPGSAAERLYYEQAALPGTKWPMPTAIAPGISPAPLDDLMYHGGKVLPQMEFQNVYLGGEAAWRVADMEAIDKAISRAMRHKELNNMMSQYFPGARLACEMRESFIREQPSAAKIDEDDVRVMVTELYNTGRIAKRDLRSCLFNLLLPPGAELTLKALSSHRGLGGFHGSLHLRENGTNVTLYYSATVFSETRPNLQNGIVAFDKPWKNVVGTLYHEINEARTDPDVNDAIENGNNDFLGWTSRNGKEVGDQPIFVANDLRLVFQEVEDGTAGKIPVQFMYSNAVHGAEGPISRPHAKIED